MTTKLKFRICNKDGQVLAAGEPSTQYADLTYRQAYQDGDQIVLDVTGLPADSRFCVVRFEDTMDEAIIWITGDKAIFPIPPSDNRTNYSPKSFTGELHYLYARPARPEEIAARRCLSVNPYDCHQNSTFYPHVHANVETRNEAVFAARNAIDGMFANASHGDYPYQSWGINRDPNAALTIDFGRTVRVDEVRITIRADFPHDNYWTHVTVDFSDGSSETFALEKIPTPQCFTISERFVTGATLNNLIMAEGESPFPALTQIEYFGGEVK